MEDHLLLLLAGGILGFGLISARVQTTVLTPPIVFVTLGALVGFLGLVHAEIGSEAIHLLAELTLVVVLFTDASRIGFGTLRAHHDLPLRLLGIGMPLTVGLGALAALWLFPGFTGWEALLLAAVLAPTDAALGQAVVTSTEVPARIRQTLNVESGLNDGIALPLVLVFLSTCASAVDGLGGTEYWLRFALLQLTLGPLVGFGVGWVGGKLVERAVDSRWMNESYEHLSSLGLALAAYAGADAIGGNGFIAAFVAGLVLGNTCEKLGDRLHDFAEAEGQLLALLVFLIFGALILPEVMPHLTVRALLYAVLSLTVVRMLPVALSLLGKGLRPATVLFLGWFGPRGLASLLFAMIVVDRSVLAAREEIYVVVVATVLLSVIVHGMTAAPATSWYARHASSMDEDEPEARPVPEMRPRIRRAS